MASSVPPGALAAPPVQAPVAAAESSPALEAGSGASSADQAERPVTQADIDKLKASFQSTLDKRERDYRRRLADADANRVSLMADLEVARFQQSLPDPTLEPEEHARKSREFAQNQANRMKTEAWIKSRLETFHLDTGISVTRSDPSLVLDRGPQAFLDSLRGIKDRNERAKQEKNRDSDRDKLREELKAEIAAEFGIDRYDGASGASSPGKRNYSMADVEKMDWQEYAANREHILGLVRSGKLR